MKVFSLNIKHAIWMQANIYQAFMPFIRFYKILGNKNLEVASKRSRIIIEGYPRCANTFAYAAFDMVQSKKIKIAHHVHGASQITFGVRHNIPTMVLIRNPKDAISSLIVREPSISVNQALKNYILFYDKVLPYKNQYVVAPFRMVINEYEKIIQAVNEKYDTSFNIFYSTPENTEKCFKIIDNMDKQDKNTEDFNVTSVARPTEEKVSLKSNVQKELLRLRYATDLSRAESLYHNIVEDLE